jgi:hypothetical protein
MCSGCGEGLSHFGYILKEKIKFAKKLQKQKDSIVILGLMTCGTKKVSFPLEK